MEIGALIHFNMATYGACHTDPSAFNPTKLDTDQWAQSFEAFGARGWARSSGWVWALA